ncbi:Microspherule protein 1-like protein [Drosera capensis]
MPLLNSPGTDHGTKHEIPRRAPTVKHPKATKGGLVSQKNDASKILLAGQALSKLADKQSQISDSVLRNGSHAADRNADVPSPVRDHKLHKKAVSTDAVFLGQPEDPLLLDSEEEFCESYDDIPRFSDIELMVAILGSVAKYQNEEAKRATVKLEQAAYSYMQRAIASHGAFAVLYGRNSKHYIKKPEVLLGRAANDVFVDIDLGREGPAKKISRQQAIIRMERDGSFHLKNLGKFPASVNGKEVYLGQSHRPQPNCLIEIQAISFIFDMIRVHVKRYLDNKNSKLTLLTLEAFDGRAFGT